MTTLTTVTSLLLSLVLVSWCGVQASSYRSYRKSGPRCPPAPGLAHGQSDVQFGGIQLRFTCDPGYVALGVAVTLCAGDHWFDPPPVCVSGGCPGLGGVKYGAVAYTHARGVAKITCEEGYKLKGSQILTCDGRRWNGTQPQCIVDTSAMKTADVINAPYLGKKYPSRSHEEWLDRSDYSCVKNRNALPPPPGINTIPAVRWSLIDKQYRLYALYRCKWGYVHAGNAKHMYCKSGHWVGHLPKCVVAAAIASDWQRLPRDESRPGSGFSHRDWLRLADYSCLGRVGAPQKIEPPRVAHATGTLKHEVLEGKPHLYVEYTCDEGYKFQDFRRYLYCKQKSWSGTAPTCVRDPKSKIKDVARGTDPCRVNNGGCAHVCVWATDVQAKCACRVGYRLTSDQKNCEDVNECHLHNGGCGQHVCINTAGSFRCQCIMGYVQARDGHSCIRVSRARERQRPANIFSRAG